MHWKSNYIFIKENIFDEKSATASCSNEKISNDSNEKEIIFSLVD